MAWADRPGFRRLQEVVERTTGLTVVEEERVSYLEEQALELSATRKELDLLGWTVMDYFSGQPQEMDSMKRRKLAQKSRTIWMDDPNAGAAVTLMNDFVFGRGVPRPKAADPEVQKVLDEAWDDPDNQLVLTSYDAQIRLGTDLQLQSNVFLVMFDDGDDGKIKLALLDHDSVENAMSDPDNRLRVLYFLAREKRVEWDFENDKPKMDTAGYTRSKPIYYPHWRNVSDLEEAGGEVPEVPEDKLGEGKVYHLAINRTSEMVFGIPEMRRTLRWFSAYNEFLRSRVDMAQAAAAFALKRKIKGTPSQVARQAAKAISRESLLGGTTGVGDDLPQQPGRGGKIVTENENSTLEPFKGDSGALAAASDAQTLRSVISAATGWPQHYLGDAGSANLATATAMELAPMKRVESRQEVFEQVFRWFNDRVIERAVEAGRLTETIEPEALEPGAEVPAETNGYGPLGEAHEDKAADEEETQRDLTYEFNMPNPLRRMMAELMGAIANMARTFDPNNTNLELTRALAVVAFGEGLEQENPAELVDRIWPEDYVDPAVAAAQQPPPPPPPEEEGAPTQPEDNPYSTKQHGTYPENPYGMAEALAPLHGRDGEVLAEHMQPHLREGLWRRRLPAAAEADVVATENEIDRLWAEDVEAVVGDALDKAMLMAPAGNGRRGKA